MTTYNTKNLKYRDTPNFPLDWIDIGWEADWYSFSPDGFSGAIFADFQISSDMVVPGEVSVFLTTTTTEPNLFAENVHVGILEFNPEQSDYNWIKNELVSITCNFSKATENTLHTFEIGAQSVQYTIMVSQTELIFQRIVPLTMYVRYESTIS